MRRDPLAEASRRWRSRQGVEVRLRHDEAAEELGVAPGDDDRDVATKAVTDEVDRVQAGGLADLGNHRCVVVEDIAEVGRSVAQSVAGQIDDE